MTETSNAYDGRPIRWGILGAGGIATKFCDDLALLPDHDIAAVGARTAGSSDAFAGATSFADLDAVFRDRR